jgi:hypothetical protein
VHDWALAVPANAAVASSARALTDANDRVNEDRFKVDLP